MVLHFIKVWAIIEGVIVEALGGCMGIVRVGIGRRRSHEGFAPRAAEEIVRSLACFITDWYFYTNFNLSMVFFLLVNYSFYYLLAGLDLR